MNTWEALRNRCRELAGLRSAMGLLAWDQQTYMPSKGSTARGEASATLARLYHERLIDPALAELVDRLDGDDPDQAAVARVLGRAIARATRLPGDLVAEERRATNEAFHAWLAARAEDRFELLAPKLERVFELARRTAAAIDADRPAYDVLLKAYEPTATADSLRPLFARLESGLVPLVDAARGGPHPQPVTGTFALDGQRALHREVLQTMGYDFQAGRLDAAEHPFSVGVGLGDVRITTHLHEHDPLAGLGATLHEGGHALYEQGLPKTLLGTGVDEAASVGLHESQSRFWENTIGRSLSFFRWLAPRARIHLGADLQPQALYRAANAIRPSLIRVYADEATYNLHVLLRFRLEVALVSGDLAVVDLPGAWNDGIERLLGLHPPTQREGCLQDVHWATGAIGYFPTYTLGNLYAARLAAAVERDVPDLWELVERGDLSPILGWLRRNVHVHGHRAETPEIVARATGDRDGVADLLDHLWSRHGALYGLERA